MKINLKKNETLITFSSIIIYIVSNLYCLNNFGLTDYRSLIINLFLVILILLIIKQNNLTHYYGLNKVTNPRKFLYFIPLLPIILINLLGGINIKNSVSEIIFYILSMFCIGFLEEIIFRGFLFKLLSKESLKKAIIISSLTFGIGHIINLLNGADFVPTLMQICYATTTGYLFAIILIQSNSLLPCIITHSLTNALSIFNTANNTINTYITPILLIIISVSYSIYLKEKNKYKGVKQNEITYNL